MTGVQQLTVQQLTVQQITVQQLTVQQITVQQISPKQVYVSEIRVICYEVSRKFQTGFHEHKHRTTDRPSGYYMYHYV